MLTDQENIETLLQDVDPPKPLGRYPHRKFQRQTKLEHGRPHIFESFIKSLPVSGMCWSCGNEPAIARYD